MPIPDIAEVIERGRKARELCNSDAFVDTVNDLSAFFLAQMAACPATEAALPALRDAHVMHTAISEIVAQLHLRIQAGEQAETHIATDDGEEDIQF